MDLRDLLAPDRVIPRLKVGSKRQLLNELAKRAADLTGLHERAIFDVLLERERLGSTGTGGGVAIPHGKLAAVGALFGLFARLEKPIEFDAVEQVGHGEGRGVCGWRSVPAPGPRNQQATPCLRIARHQRESGSRRGELVREDAGHCGPLCIAA